MPEYLDNEMLPILLDAVLILAVIGLWVLWWGQIKQRQKIEGMLTEASTQLQEATLMLNQALVQIQDLQSRDRPEDAVSARSSKATEPVAEEQPGQKIEEKVQAGVESQSHASANISQVAQMLRLQREGETPEKIARKLDLPLAQIKLMLMLQSTPKS